MTIKPDFGEINQFRRQVDDFMRNHPQSPLDHEQRRGFRGLSYFAPDEAFVFVVEVRRFPDDEPLIQMETSTGDVRLYRRWGEFSVTVAGESGSLTIYSDPQGEDFFLPFKDATNGAETYGAGRYLDNHRPGLTRLHGNMWEVDFNFAYNPYCAYSPYYSCPLPPRENWLKIPIRAGEKSFM
ncbi:MAG: DUF1684 domain-containing protein [Anaerolineales bacterium]|nr:DUF1684 domain-containing protein [Anaerolineales bacterium]MCB8953138.1 DUF1684 domain-containing protein [Ardenticatenales bacterium]